MIVLLRLLVLASIAALVASAFIPLDSAYQVTVEHDKPPLMPLVFGAASVLLVPLFPVSVYGLLRIRRWSSAPASVTAICLLVLAATALHPTALGISMSALGKITLIFAVGTWFAAVIVSFLPPVRHRTAVAR